ncbi:hypothetical protein [Janthinobacterium agaricidamnosum]|uniref:hypothetical protein n=1 Tax=Janthinobacterium agaricidamnosum TaxID=55508 RepID=UPI001184B846|nr:hypothetical protein [Janthinobacterium agaricidamnosum]
MSAKRVMAHAAVAAVPASGIALPQGLQRRADGLFFNIKMAASDLQAALDQVFRCGAYFSGLDYRATAC